jgi:hypothetical protein
MTNRRFTRLTNALSKKIENHAAAVAPGYFAYNFIKIHRTLRMTPAMAAGVNRKLWEVAGLVVLWEAYEQPTSARRKSLRKRATLIGRKGDHHVPGIRTRRGERQNQRDS